MAVGCQCCDKCRILVWEGNTRGNLLYSPQSPQWTMHAGGRGLMSPTLPGSGVSFPTAPDFIAPQHPLAQNEMFIKWSPAFHWEFDPDPGCVWRVGPLEFNESARTMGYVGNPNLTTDLGELYPLPGGKFIVSLARGLDNPYTILSVRFNCGAEVLRAFDSKTTSNNVKVGPFGGDIPFPFPRLYISRAWSNAVNDTYDPSYNCPTAPTELWYYEGPAAGVTISGAAMPGLNGNWPSTNAFQTDKYTTFCTPPSPVEIGEYLGAPVNVTGMVFSVDSSAPHSTNWDSQSASRLGPSKFGELSISVTSLREGQSGGPYQSFFSYLFRIDNIWHNLFAPISAEWTDIAPGGAAGAGGLFASYFGGGSQGTYAQRKAIHDAVFGGFSLGQY